MPAGRNYNLARIHGGNSCNARPRLQAGFPVGRQVACAELPFPFTATSLANIGNPFPTSSRSITSVPLFMAMMAWLVPAHRLRRCRTRHSQGGRKRSRCGLGHGGGGECHRTHDEWPRRRHVRHGLEGWKGPRTQWQRALGLTHDPRTSPCGPPLSAKGLPSKTSGAMWSINFTASM